RREHAGGHRHRLGNHGAYGFRPSLADRLVELGSEAISEGLLVLAFEGRIGPARVAHLQGEIHGDPEALVQFAGTPKRAGGDGGTVVAGAARNDFPALRLAVEAVAVPHEFDEVVVRFRTGSREIDARVLDRGERGEAL